MWVNEISIDKQFLTEYDYLIARLDCIKNLSYTKETTKDRFVCSLASTDDYKSQIETKLFEIVKNIILVMLKRRIVFEGIDKPDSFVKVAIFSSIIYFDSVYEEKYLLSKMNDINDYNIDAIVNFRLKKLKRNWLELKSLTEDMLYYADEGDLSYITSIMANSGKEKVQELMLSKSDGQISLNSSKNKCEILPIYTNNYYNVLDSILRINPKAILLRNITLPTEMTNLLKKILLVKFT